MKSGEKITSCLMIMILVISIVTLSGCIEISKENNSFARNQFLPRFEVHEWGVFYQKYNSNVTIIQNPSLIKKIMIFAHPDKPVIYFHYKENISYVSVEVNISEDLVIIPNATIIGDKIRWDFALVNNSIYSNETLYDYLFYEGRITCSQPVIAEVSINGSIVTFHVKNIADYPISHIFFVYTYPQVSLVYNTIQYDKKPAYKVNIYPVRPFPYRNHIDLRSFVYIENLEAGEEKIISKAGLTNYFNYTPIRNILNNSGLTKNETNDLLGYWSEIWFATDVTYDENGAQWHKNYYENMETAQIIFMIPEDVYNNLLPITINPVPETLKRVGLFYINQIPINKNNTIVSNMASYVGNIEYFDAPPAIGCESDPSGYILTNYTSDLFPFSITSSYYDSRFYLNFLQIEPEIDIDDLFGKVVRIYYNSTYSLSAGGVETPQRYFTGLLVSKIEVLDNVTIMSKNN